MPLHLPGGGLPQADEIAGFAAEGKVDEDVVEDGAEGAEEVKGGVDDVPGELEVSVLNATKDPHAPGSSNSDHDTTGPLLKLSMAPTGCRLPTLYCI